VSKFEELQTRPAFAEELETVARAVTAAVGKSKSGAGSLQGSINIEVSLSALMMVAAGIIAADVNLTTMEDLNRQTDSFADMLKDMALADRQAGEAGEPQFLQILGGIVVPGKRSGLAN
jgi:hypothetical protein